MSTVSSPGLPSAYYLEVGTETISLYRSDGSKVGVFGSRGAKFEPIRLLAEEDGPAIRSTVPKARRLAW
jgi:hypothetical protein